MFGKNALARPTWDAVTLNVNSIFDTIQGEGPFTGCRATFIRLQGCNLRCHFCDTEFESGEEYGVDHLVTLACESPNELVVITGGEPMLQNLVPLIDDLCKAGKLVQIETAGHIAAPGILECAQRNKGWFHIVVSPKTTKVSNAIRACPFVHFKYIISATDNQSSFDGLPLSGTQLDSEGREVSLARPYGNELVFVSPMDEMDAVKHMANVARCVEIVKKHGHRLSLQVHKIVGVE